MKATIKHLAQVLTITLLIQISSGWAADDRIAKMTEISMEAAKKIGGPKKIGTQLTLNWSENPEVKEIAAFESSKRIATLMAIINHLKKNEEKIFPNITNPALNKANQEQLTISLITRLFSLTHLTSLITVSDYDVAVKDFLDGEIADLKLVLDFKIGYYTYIQSQKMRENKLLLILMLDKEILTELFTLNVNDMEGDKEASIAHVLANKTTNISLFEACATNPDLCSKLKAK